MVVAAGVTGATVAEGAVGAGTFSGATTAKDPLGFKVKSGRVVSFYFEHVQTTCSDKDHFPTPSGKYRVQTPAKKRFRITSAGRFAIKARNPKTGFGWDAKGQFAGKSSSTARGTLKVFARFNDENYQDPKGDITCSSGTVKWTAKRR
jgi:lipoprotein-anchoring transpeptidase ErfK/SrfK